MTDDTAPAWATAMLVTLDEIRAEAQSRFDAINSLADLLNRAADRVERAADKMEQANRIIAATGRAHEGRDK